VNIKQSDSEFSFETQAVRLFRTLEFEILAGKFQPGDRLVRRDLTKRFKLSQATVSEALWRLESEGLAESAPMYGTRVARITLQRIHDELVLREAMECQVARLAAGKAAPADKPQLIELADKVDALLRGSDSYSKDDMLIHQDFHIALARLTGSHLLVKEIERVWRRHFMFFSWVSAQVWPSPKHWHRALVRAIYTGDPDVAERAMREHVQYGAAHQLEVLEKIQHDKQNLSLESLAEKGT